jgi:hypothetical protein
VSESKHTKGPWESEGNVVYALHGEPPRNRFFVFVQGGRLDDATPEECEANARLIASAPDLLAALQAADLAISCARRLEYDDSAVRDQIRAAISKATGGAE